MHILGAYTTRLPLLMILLFLASCKAKGDKDFFYKITDSATNGEGYVNYSHDTIVPLGRYAFCFTDTFKNYAIVEKQNEGFIAIDRSEKVRFHVFAFDNGPDYPSEGLFRITADGKIGYADTNGDIVIKPKYGCAYPFENGRAKVSLSCSEAFDGEHKTWLSNDWFYINKSGQKLDTGTKQ